MSNEGSDSKRVTLEDLAQQQGLKKPALTSTFDAELGSKIGMTLLAMDMPTLSGELNSDEQRIDTIVQLMEKFAHDGEADEILQDSAARKAIATSIVKDGLVLSAAIGQYRERMAEEAAAAAVNSADTIAQVVTPLQQEVMKVMVAERLDPETAEARVRERIAAGDLDIKE